MGSQDIKQELLHAWAKHLQISYGHAQADWDCISRVMGEVKTAEYMHLKMGGDQTTSLNDFAKRNGYYCVDWGL